MAWLVGLVEVTELPGAVAEVFPVGAEDPEVAELAPVVDATPEEGLLSVVEVATGVEVNVTP